jgi:hypothetical protein
MAQRGMRALRRHPLTHTTRKAFASFSTDYGYRRTAAWRNVSGERLVSAWSQADCDKV